VTGMIGIFDPVRFDAFAALLARPDPRDLPRRAHVSRRERDPSRRSTRLPGILMDWLQRRHLEIDVGNRSHRPRERGSVADVQRTRVRVCCVRPALVREGA